MSGVKRAIISVSDKTGVVAFARALADLGVELLSTGGTARAIREAGIAVKDISEFTGFPEMMDGRVKTLHPRVHAGLLCLRDSEDHMNQMKEQGMTPIDLVCVNLYPFEATIAKSDVTLEEAIENIDIGGPTMLRSAAKNMKYVTVVTNPDDYDRVIAEMKANDGATTEAFRFELGQKVYARTAEYDAMIARYLGQRLPEGAPQPFVIACTGGVTLRYGENPHQQARFYKNAAATEACIAHTEVLHGKEMSFNNYVDGNGALEAVKELSGEAGVAIIKHTNPCGYATGKTLSDALEAAWAGDPVSAFGSVIAVTQPVDLAFAETLKGRFVEAIIAPDFDAEALDYLMSKSKNIRLLKLEQSMGRAGSGMDVKQINGGWLVQDRDMELIAQFESVTKIPFPEEKRALAEFGMKGCKHVKSNAILLVREYAPGFYSVLGMGAGQPNRVDAVRKLAIAKARENVALLYAEEAGYQQDPEAFFKKIMNETVLISDAFFPFADNIEFAAEAGIRYILEPGGSVRDDEVIAAADEKGIAMVFTGMRHFKH
ncbi:MAG: bifunctional phosphoribosylaminoimidazolecarboxamide formyltransferase/IMP cyclohydrolase [Kiritimatiellae bacterium]|nr:bifunctional phosphoribosylaminoimidazolecarboxamide formyltransferase/IMP cyclohydrolase [Kiritimatiellia bacterium]MDD4734579.1 bifunctional phosphoribosylaminoimidazolecarboxamide formyltransferase/IMP cyclohydrolase [Kiritimatiellia bacterium]